MELLNLICSAINISCYMFELLILVRIIFSWLGIHPNSFMTKFVYELTELVLAPIRNLLRKLALGSIGMSLDFSPIVACLLIRIFNSIMINMVIYIYSILFK